MHTGLILDKGDDAIALKQAVNDDNCKIEVHFGYVLRV